jgi:hypothetical protein
MMMKKITSATQKTMRLSFLCAIAAGATTFANDSSPLLDLSSLEISGILASNARPRTADSKSATSPSDAKNVRIINGMC